MEVREYYDNFSINYDKFYEGIQIKKFSSSFDLITFKTGWTIDLGGGTGLLSEYIDYPLVTLDISFKMLRSGINKKREYLPIAGDLQNLPLRSNTVSSFYSYTAIQNSSNPKGSIEEISRIMSRGGRGLITYLSKSKIVPVIEDSLSHLNLTRIKLELEDTAYIVSY